MKISNYKQLNWFNVQIFCGFLWLLKIEFNFLTKLDHIQHKSLQSFALKTTVISLNDLSSNEMKVRLSNRAKT